MQNQFHHIFNNRFCMALLILALVGLVSFSYVSSVFAPTSCTNCGYKQFQKTNLAGRSSNQNQNQTTANSTKSVPANSIQ